MPQVSTFNSSPADVRRGIPQGLLRVTSCPAAAEATCLGKTLIELGSLTVVGAYACEIQTDDFTVLEVIVKPSSVTGVFAPSVDRMYADRATVRASAAGAANFANNTEQTLSFSALNGSQRCRLAFTIPGGGAITFTRAEYNGL